MKTEQDIYGQALMDAGIKEDYSGTQLALLHTKYLIRAAQTTPQNAFRELFKSYMTNQHLSVATASIESELTKYCKTTTIDVNPVTRIASKLAKKNAWIKCMALEGLSEEENTKLQNKALQTIPEVFLPKIEPKFTKYSATATTKSGKATKFEIEFSV